MLGACVFLKDGFHGDTCPRRVCQILGSALFNGLSSGMQRLCSRGVMAMSILTSCVVEFNHVLALSHIYSL